MNRKFVKIVSIVLAVIMAASVLTVAIMAIVH